MYGQIVIYDMKYGVGDKRGSSPLNKLIIKIEWDNIEWMWYNGRKHGKEF